MLQRISSCDDFVIAYGNSSFSFAMKGMGDKCWDQKRLVILFSKSVSLVMTGKYRTTIMKQTKLNTVATTAIEIITARRKYTGFPIAKNAIDCSYATMLRL